MIAIGWLWVLVAGLIVIAGLALIVSAFKAKLARRWQLGLGVLGLVTTAGGLYLFGWLYAFMSGL